MSQPALPLAALSVLLGQLNRRKNAPYQPCVLVQLPRAPAKMKAAVLASYLSNGDRARGFNCRETKTNCEWSARGARRCVTLRHVHCTPTSVFRTWVNFAGLSARARGYALYSCRTAGGNQSVSLQAPARFSAFWPGRALWAEQELYWRGRARDCCIRSWEGNSCMMWINDESMMFGECWLWGYVVLLCCLPGKVEISWSRVGYFRCPSYRDVIFQDLCRRYL